MSDNVTDFTFLQGVKVIDFTQFEAGPSCTEALAWLGAEVVKIENPNRGDPGRRLQPNKPDTDPYYFHMFNANKKSVAINLKSPEGLDLAKEMIRQADVMMENFAPGAIERMGLSYDVVKEINPGIIYAQVKGFGEGSPFEKNLSFDMIAQACGGTFSVTGEMDGPPIRPGVTVGDTGTGMLMAVSILGAYVRRLRTGQGEHLQVAMQDAILHYIRNAFAYMERSGGGAAPRAGSKTVGGGWPPIGVFPCKGGGPNDYVYIFASPANPEHWNRLLKVMGREDLLDDERYNTAAARVEHADEVNALVAEWTKQHDKRTAMKLVGEATVPSGAVLDTRELADDKTFEDRKIRQTMHHPKVGDYVMSGWPVRFGGEPPAIGPAPLLDEHHGSVLKDWLGEETVQSGSLESA